jgi:hypothetical protein
MTYKGSDREIHHLRERLDRASFSRNLGKFIKIILLELARSHILTGGRAAHVDSSDQQVPDPVEGRHSTSGNAKHTSRRPAGGCGMPSRPPGDGAAPGRCRR